MQCRRAFTQGRAGFHAAGRGCLAHALGELGGLLRLVVVVDEREHEVQRLEHRRIERLRGEETRGGSRAT